VDATFALQAPSLVKILSCLLDGVVTQRTLP
jgi:hypothetical protein